MTSPATRRLITWVLTIAPIWISALVGIVWKSNCFGPDYGPLGETLGLDMRHLAQYMCGTDIQVMWDQRGLGQHLFPYIFGSFTPPDTLVGGTVEYPVFSGLVMWLSALPVANGLGFLISTTVLMAAAASFAAIVLRSLVGNWVYLFSFAPATLLYMSYNWDMLPVLCTALAVWVVVRGPVGWSETKREVIAAVLLGVGALFKLYPALFVFALAAWILSRRMSPAASGDRTRLDWRGAWRVVLVTGSTFLLGNLPFAVLGLQGWLASFQFQSKRFITSDTLSVWWWFMYPILHQPGITNRWLGPVTALATVLALLGAAAAVWLGWKRHRRGEVYPWVQVAAAMLAAYLLLNKVHSLQYALWLLPFFVLVAIPTWQIIAYYLIDLGLFLSWFASVYWALTDDSVKVFWFAVAGFVYLRIAMLVLLFFSFSRAQTRPLRFRVPNAAGLVEPVMKLSGPDAAAS
ncbi:MAG: hypothetical protein ACOYBP_05095 [Microbacteriaceae bacterium]